MLNEQGHLDKWVHLVNLYNDVEADIVEALLETNGITVTREYPKNSAITKIIMGTPLGVDVFVREEDYETAKKIIESTDFQQEDMEPEEDLDN